MSSVPPSGFHPTWLDRHDRLWSGLIGFRNGILTGVRIRLPYVIQSLVYAGIFRDEASISKSKFVMKAAFHHGRNLGLFVLIYKSVCHIFRKYLGISNGLESWVAGFLGGFTAFGESKGISGSVNMQITMYLMIRGLFGLATKVAEEKSLPSSLNVSTPVGFRVFAGLSLALILYMTEYQPKSLQKGFMSTMNYLYYDSDHVSEALVPERNFMIFYFIVVISLFSPIIPKLGLDNILSRVLG